jgi:hypothetical protein
MWHFISPHAFFTSYHVLAILHSPNPGFSGRMAAFIDKIITKRAQIAAFPVENVQKHAFYQLLFFMDSFIMKIRGFPT